MPAEFGRQRPTDWHGSVDAGLRLPELPIDGLGPDAQHRGLSFQLHIVVLQPEYLFPSETGVDVHSHHCSHRWLHTERVELLDDLPLGQESDLGRGLAVPPDLGDWVSVRGEPDPVLLGRPVEEPAEDLPVPVRGLGLEPLRPHELPQKLRNHGRGQRLEAGPFQRHDIALPRPTASRYGIGRRRAPS